MVQMPRIPNGWLDSDDSLNGLSIAPAKTMIGPEGPSYTGIGDGIFGGLDNGALDAFRQMHALHDGGEGGAPDIGDGTPAVRSVEAPDISPAPLNPDDSAFRMPGQALGGPPVTGVAGLSDLFPEDAKVRMTASDKLRNYLTHREVYKPVAYNDNPQHPEHGTATIGYGHTQDVGALSARYPGGIPLHPIGQFIFDADLEPAERAVRENLKVPVSQNQYDALVDFAFNAGVGALKSSPMLNYLNSGDADAAADAFAKSRITQKGAPVRGLMNRRADETDMFRTGNSADRYSRR